MHAPSGGNPFYLEQLARSPHAGAAAAATDGAPQPGTGVPAAVVASLAEELGLLPDPVRRVLEGAALAGDPFEPELAAAAAGFPEPEAMEALDELLRRDLVRSTELPRRFRFRHPLVRRAVYEAAPAAWRLGAHERAAGALAARGAPPAERAHHVERSARRGDGAAVALLREAGAATASRAPASAARFYGAALRLMAADGPVADRIELLNAMAAAHAAAGQYADALDAWREALDLVPAEALSLRVSLTAACAGMENLTSRHEEAHTRLLNAPRGAAGHRLTRGGALMLGAVSVDGLYRMEYASMSDWARRAPRRGAGRRRPCAHGVRVRDARAGLRVQRRA